MQLQGDGINSTRFGSARHIQGVRQAARNLRGVYENCHLSKNKGRTLMLDCSMSKKGVRGFNNYIKSLSLDEVRSLLTAAEKRVKINIAATFRTLIGKNWDDMSESDKVFRKKVEDYLKNPLILLPQK